jgi:hypothetical protein
MKYLFLTLFSLSLFANDSLEIEAIYSCPELAQKLEYSTIISIQYKGNHRYLVSTTDCKVFVDVNSLNLKIHKLTCWP